MVILDPRVRSVKQRKSQMPFLACAFLSATKKVELKKHVQSLQNLNKIHKIHDDK